MDSSGDENLSNKIGLGDDDFVDKPTEFDDGEQSSSRRTTDHRKPRSPANTVPEENVPRREPKVLPNGRYVCPYCDSTYKNRATYMNHKLVIHRIVDRVVM